MSTSHYSSRPAQNDVGSDTIRIPIAVCPPNAKKHTRLAATIWLLVGIGLLLADGCAMAHFADSGVEACIVAALTMPTGILVILAALESRK
jgi:hypothetical protein